MTLLGPGRLPTFRNDVRQTEWSSAGSLDAEAQVRSPGWAPAQLCTEMLVTRDGGTLARSEASCLVFLSLLTGE